MLIEDIWGNVFDLCGNGLELLCGCKVIDLTMVLPDLSDSKSVTSSNCK